MVFQEQWSRQSVVSFVILSLLCCVGITVLRIHAQGSKNTALSFATTGQTPPAASSELIPGFTPSLPIDFTSAGNPEKYDRETLYEKINGKAPLYLEAGFASLTTQRFINTIDSTLWFEAYVYDMGSPQGAFSVYSTQKRPDAGTEASLVPIEHYLTQNGLFLHHGQYYVECVGSAVAEILHIAMTDFAGRFAALELGKKQEDTGEVGLAFFPQENLKKESFAFILNDAFGAQVLTNTYVSKYDLHGIEVSAFISKRKDSNEARQIADSYYRFLLDGGATAVDSEEGMRIADLYGLIEIVFSVGPYVAGIREAESLDQGLELTGKLRESLDDRL